MLPPHAPDTSLWAAYLEARHDGSRRMAALALVEALGPVGPDELLAMASGPAEGPAEAASRLRRDLLELSLASAERWGVPRVGLLAALSLGDWPLIRLWARRAGDWTKPARWAVHEAQGHWRPPSPDAVAPFRPSEARAAARAWARALASAARSEEPMPEAFAWPIAAGLAGVAAGRAPAMARCIQGLGPRLSHWAGPGGLAATRLALALVGPVHQAGPGFAAAWALASEASLQANFAEAMSLAVGARAMLAQAHGEDAMAWLEAAAGS